MSERWHVGLLNHALVQAFDRRERGQDRTLLPGIDVGAMLTGEHGAAVDRTKVLVVVLARSSVHMP